MTPQARARWASLAMVLVLTALATLVRVVLDPMLADHNPYALFLAAVAAAAWYGGGGAGLLAAALGSVAGWLFFVVPHSAAASETGPHFVNLGLYVAASGVVLAASETLRREKRGCAEAQARERLARERLEALIDNTPLAVVEYDPELRISRWSGEAKTLFGWTAAEAVGRTLEELRVVRREDAEKLRQTTHRLQDPAECCVVTRQVNLTRTGERRQCEWYSSVFRDEQGGVAAILSLALDVTEREGLERTLRESDRRKDEFLATLAHELRNPLAPMRNALEIMRLAGPGSGASERARALIERQLAQMVRLIDDLLDVSRISLGKLELRRERVELAAVVASAVETSRPTIEASGHELQISMPDEPVYLEADLTRLAQALLNLLNNAARYMEAGGSILLSARREQEDVVIGVKDAGVGIPREMLPHIFSMSTQGSRFLHRSEAGLGVGLTLVRRLVELHGGTVEAHSEGVGKGSEFVVRLRTAPAPTKPATADERPAASAPPRRILVVDDNVDAAVSLATMLQMMGHETETAHEGLSALESAARWRPDVVLLDIGMPRISGYEVAARIRQFPWGEGMSLVALTGWGQEEDRRRSREAGFDHHLVKPVHPETLARLLSGLAPRGDHRQAS